jgi:GNAT superfamily N-acetyltransferase
VEVRQVRPAEYEAAGDIVVAAYRALPGAHLSNGYAEQLADVGRRALEAEVLVAVDDRLLGCVTFVPDATSPWAEMLKDDEAAVRMLGVDPTVQGRGVGGALLGACVDRARRLGRAAVFLHSTPWISMARRVSCASPRGTGSRSRTCPCWRSAAI